MIAMSEDPGPESSVNNNTKKNIFSKISEFFINLISFKDDQPQDLKESLEDLAEGVVEKEAPLTKEEQRLFKNIISLRHYTVDEIIIPRTDIIAIASNTNLDYILKLINDNQISRIPVYEENLDNIIGFIHIKDTFKYLDENNKKDFKIADIIRKILFVPPIMHTSSLLMKMRNSGIHIAIIVDEYGGTKGLVCLEDLIECIIGDIHDEHDVEDLVHLDERVKKNNDGSLEVSGRCTIKYLEEFLNINLIDNEESDDFDTIAGLISFISGSIPKNGDIIEHPKGYKFKILEADSRKINKILIYN